MSKTATDNRLLADWAKSLETSLETGLETSQPFSQPFGQQAAPQAAVRGHLLARVAASAAAHREYLTVRRENTPWLPCASGVRQRVLRHGAQFELALLDLQDGAALPAAPAGCAQELLLVEGGLRTGDHVLSVYSHAVMPASGATAAADLRAQGPAQVYRRLLRVPVQDLPTIQASWWQAGFRAHVAKGFTPPQAWVDTSPGVQVMPLRAKGAVVSMLVRFEPGARVPDHGHTIDEDCLVLQGEMFLGDILLRAGDYQLAPAGGSHFDENSDVGVCFFFHGALDDALRGAPKP